MSAMRISGAARAVVASALAVVLAAPLAGCGVFGGESEPEVAAVVAGAEITSDRVDELFARFAGTEAGAAALAGAENGLRVSEEQVRANVLSYAIKVAFLDVLAERQGVAVPESLPGSEDVFEDFAGVGTFAVQGFQGEDFRVAQRAEAIGKAIAAKLLPTVSITEEEKATAFEERKELFAESFRATTGIAFMDSSASAEQLRAEIADGSDFEAATAALDANVVASSDLEINPLSTPVQQELIDAATALEVGETSEPISIEFQGTPLFVVLLMKEREDLPAVSLKEAEADLVEIITNRRRKDVYDEWLKKQYVEADISVDGYYGRWEPNLQAVI